MFGRTKSIDAILALTSEKPLRRSLSLWHLILLGVGGIIGTGIFVLTAEAAVKAGPAMMVSFVIAGFVCCLTALIYAELAGMIPAAGSSYTFAYAAFGEFVAWLIGWALVLEYMVAASAVSVGWSGYMAGLLRDMGIADLGTAFTHGPFDPEPGYINLPAFLMAIAVGLLLVLGTRASAQVNAIFVVLKLAALALFITLAYPALDPANFTPFSPYGLLAHEVADPVSGHLMTVGISAAAATIFFAYIGFDALCAATEEAHDPRRDVPLGLVGSLVICTVIYIVIAAGAIGAVGAQPGGALSRSDDALAMVMRVLGHPLASAFLQVVAVAALPTVLLVMLYGQTRIFFVIARDGLLPEAFTRVNRRFGTPHVVTLSAALFVAVFAAIFPVGKLAELSNSGTLFAFTVVALAALRLRYTEPQRPRSFRVPFIAVAAPLSALSCLFLLSQLSAHTLELFVVWALIGLLVYFGYGRRRSHLAPR